MGPDLDSVPPARPAAARALRGALAIVLFGGTAVVTLHAWLGVGPASFGEEVTPYVYDAVVLAASVACFIRARLVASERWAWVLLGAGILSWAVGEIYWTEFVVDDPSPPYPSPADGFFLGLYPLAYAGLALLVRARSRELKWRLWADAAIAALASLALGWASVFDYISDRTSGTTLEVATSLAYPLGDILLISLVIGVIALSGWHVNRTWALLLAGLGATGLADIAYATESSQGVIAPGNWIDPIYLISASLLGAVLWLPRAGELESSASVDSRGALVPPVLFAAVAVGFGIAEYIARSSDFSVVLWAATAAAIFMRLTASMRENRVLLDRALTDSLTSLLNRGAIDADLEAACRRASAQSPLAVVMYDLNGFKRFNDMRGHPAGDELLAAMGRRLRDAVGDDGTAYRTGGDEFCVLFTCGAEAFETALKRSTEALTATGPGFSVGVSWGVAWVPAEASTPSDALQLADIRMYAQKESRRVARGAGEYRDAPVNPERSLSGFRPAS